MDLYAQNILDHYKHPHNKGRMLKADLSHHELNDTCGDDIYVDLKMSGNKIKKIKFDGQGCAISQAGISILSEALLEKTKEEIMAYNFDDLKKIFGIKISERRYKCASLSLWAIQHALEKYKIVKKKK
jgi:nitrogen fixation NifU-like protein